MQRRNLIIIGVAVLLGLFAVYLANAYFSGIEQRERRIAEQQKLERIVVASQDLAFGMPLATSNVKLANWPANSVPQGAFRTIEDALRDGRVALRPILAGEPILAERVSGKDGRASIAYELPEGMRAVSIPVNAVSAVSGFVRPGDVVDVLLTRGLPGSESDQLTDVLLPNVRVLAIDQVANEKDTNPKVGKTAVVLVDQTGAQVLTLARQVGALSLALRNVENQEFDEVRFAGARKFITTRDLNRGRPVVMARPQPAAAPVQVAAAGPQTAPAMRRLGGPTMTVIRGTQPTSYEVR